MPRTMRKLRVFMANLLAQNNCSTKQVGELGMQVVIHEGLRGELSQTAKWLYVKRQERLARFRAAAVYDPCDPPAIKWGWCEPPQEPAAEEVVKVEVAAPVIASPPPPLPPPQHNKIDLVMWAACRHFGLKRYEICSERRHSEWVYARQVAMYVARQLGESIDSRFHGLASLPAIGRRFGGRDHTTVLHSWKKIDRLVRSDPCVAADCADIMRTIGEVI